MSTSEIVSYVVVPVVLFVLGATGTGIVGIVKITAYLSKSREAQESTAGHTKEMAQDLKAFINEANGRLNDHGERISVLENIAGVK